VLSAKLGIASGLNLAEVCRERFPASVVWTMWVVMEVVAMATDLAESWEQRLVSTSCFTFRSLGRSAYRRGHFFYLGLERYGFARSKS